jgi:hypothetical protein
MVPPRKVTEHQKAAESLTALDRNDIIRIPINKSLFD